MFQTVAEGVPPDTALLELCLDSIMPLPPGAAYRADKGRLHVEVTANARQPAAGNRLAIRAWTDSVQRTVSTETATEEYAAFEGAFHETAVTDSSSNTVRTTAEKPPNTVAKWLSRAKWTFIVIAVIAILALISKLRMKN